MMACETFCLADRNLIRHYEHSIISSGLYLQGHSLGAFAEPQGDNKLRSVGSLYQDFIGVQISQETSIPLFWILTSYLIHHKERKPDFLRQRSTVG
tara:strand:- start:511 stop:798 length:288 start_codon:yes stop_codon:yes gene_type:complete